MLRLIAILRFLVLAGVVCGGGLWHGVGVRAQGLEVELAAAMAGAGVYADGRWAVVRSVLGNPGASDEQGVLVVRQPAAATGGLQYGSRQWVPAGARRTAYTPLRLADQPDGERSIEIEGLLITGPSGSESATPPVPSLLVAAGRTRYVGLIELGTSGSLASTVRSVAPGLGDRSRVISLASGNLAAMDRTLAWDALELVVVADTGEGLGQAQTESLRRWMLAGGRVWLMLGGESSPGVEALGRKLAGPDWGLAVVGSTQISDVPEAGLGATGNARDGSHDMARVIWPGAERLREVGGYPAALRKPVGRGELLVTTLPLHAWMGLDGKPGPWVADSLAWIYPGTTPASVMRSGMDEEIEEARQAMGTFGRSQVGYAVAGRGGVLVVLILFVAALAGGGVWLSRKGRPEQFAWVGAAVAVIAAGVLIGMGLARQSAVPATLAEAQVIIYPEGHADALVRSTLSLYRPPVSSAAGVLTGDTGTPDVDAAGLGGGLARLVWQDRQRWAFEVLNLPPGVVHTLAVESVQPRDSAVTATLDLSADTATGTFTAATLDGGLSDPLLITPGGRYAVRLTADASGGTSGGGGFRLASDDPMAAGVYSSAGGVMTSTQITRAAMTAGVVEARGWGDRPMLVGWTGGEPSGVSLGDAVEVQRRREALVAIPIRVATPVPGSTVHVPPALMRFDLDRQGRSVTAYDPTTGQWVPNITMPQTIWLRFTPPAEVGRLQLDEARLRIELDAPQRQVRVLTHDGGVERELATLQSPEGVDTLTLRGDQLPAADAEGAVSIGLAIGDAADFAATPPSWTMHNVSLGVRGIAPGVAQNAPGAESNQ